MTQEDKELLLKDLCARLPYKMAVEDEYGDTLYLDYKDVHFEHYINNILEGNIKPYLFPFSSITEEQKMDLTKFVANGIYNENIIYDWYNKNHFDYRGLIEKGLAIDATRLNIY